MYPPCFVSGCLLCLADVDWAVFSVYFVLAISMHLVHCTPAPTSHKLIRRSVLATCISLDVVTSKFNLMTCIDSPG
jgi:hypothetical protein